MHITTENQSQKTKQRHKRRKKQNNKTNSEEKKINVTNKQKENLEETKKNTINEKSAPKPKLFNLSGKQLTRPPKKRNKVLDTQIEFLNDLPLEMLPLLR